MASPTLAQHVRGAFNEDPRPDLPEDSNDWRVLLSIAFAFDGEQAEGCFAALLGARCIGMRFVGGKLDPRPESEADWPALRRDFLLPHSAHIAALLRLASESPKCGT